MAREHVHATIKDLSERWCNFATVEYTKGLMALHSLFVAVGQETPCMLWLTDALVLSVCFSATFSYAWSSDRRSSHHINLGPGCSVDKGGGG